MGTIAGSYIASPTNIAALSNICLIHAGSQQGYAVDTAGKLWVWGNNGSVSTPGGTYGFNLGFAKAGVFNTPTQQVSLPNLLFMGGSGPKLYSGDTAPRHFSAAFYEDGYVRHWGGFSYGNTVILSHNIPEIASTNINWGYTDLFYGSPVYATAFSRGATSWIQRTTRLSGRYPS